MNGPSGPEVNTLTQLAKDMGLNPTWFNFFQQNVSSVKRMNLFL